MIEPVSQVVPQWPKRNELREALVGGDRVLEQLQPTLRHLLSARDHSLLSEAIVAGVRGMVLDLAAQFLRVQADATGEKGREEFAREHREELAEAFFANASLIHFCHALAVEWQLAKRLEHEAGLDPVLSPFLQSCIGHEDGQVASAAMAAVAAQARFVQSQRRMELPLGELTGELLHEATQCWRGRDAGGQSDALDRAEAKIRGGFDEAASRSALLDRLAITSTTLSGAALNVEQGGAALFLSALALKTDQSRSAIALACFEPSMARLSLSMRAAGMKVGEVEAQLLRLFPDHLPPEGLDEIGTREAARILAAIPSGKGE